MENLITENIEVGAPANPVIVQNVASLPGGVEIEVSRCEYADYPGGVDKNNYPKVLKAGHLVFQTIDGTWASLFINIRGAFLNAIEYGDMVAHAIGVITEDAPVYRDGNEDHRAIGSIMLIGIVDASQCPAKIDKESILSRFANPIGDVMYVDGALDVCQIAFINRPPMDID